MTIAPLLSPTGIDLFPKHGILWAKKEYSRGRRLRRSWAVWMGCLGFLCTRMDASLSGTGLYIAQVLHTFCTV